MIDLLALEWQITEKADKGIHVAPIVRELIAELKEARAMVVEHAKAVHDVRVSAYYDGVRDGTKMGGGEECSAVIAFLRGARLEELAEAVRRGEHRREDGK